MTTLSRALLAVAVAGTAFAAGCRTINKGISEAVLDHKEPEQWEVHYGSRVHYLLNDTTIKEVDFEGSLIAGDTMIRYQRGLADQAQCIADKTNELLGKVRQRTGVAISTHSTMYMLRFDDQPQDFDVMFNVEPNELPLPMFVQVGSESCEDILVQNRGYPYMIVHEIVETSLAAGRNKGVVLPDPSWGLLGVAMHMNNYTRWFREGLANYAGYVAYEAICEEIPSSRRLRHRQMLLHTNPFSSLAAVGDKLFSWVQSSRTVQERMYYNAALGLFLLVADTYGERAIRDIVNEIGTRRMVDGRDLRQIFNRVLGVDIRQMARDFRFPEVGVELERLTPAEALNNGIDIQEGLFIRSLEKDGPAARARLQEKDVITAAGGVAMANELDFELALFRARKQPSVALTVQRREAGTLTIELPLQKPEPSGKFATKAGKRRNPLKKGRIESTASPLFFAF